MKEKQLEKINENLEIIWQKLEGIEHYLQVIAGET